MIEINRHQPLEPRTSDSNWSRVTIDAIKLPRDRAALNAMLLAEIARRTRAEERATAEAERAKAEAERADALIPGAFPHFADSADWAHLDPEDTASPSKRRR